MSVELPIILGYIGPGGGIGLLGPLFGVISAVVVALVMTALWPIRMMIKRIRRAHLPADNAATATNSCDEP